MAGKREALEALDRNIDRAKYPLKQQVIDAEKEMHREGVSMESAMAKMARQRVAAQKPKIKPATVKAKPAAVKLTGKLKPRPTAPKVPPKGRVRRPGTKPKVTVSSPAEERKKREAKAKKGLKKAFPNEEKK